MFAATLKLPATFQNHDIEALGEGLEALSQTAMREDNQRDALWSVTWSFDAEPDVVDLKARLYIRAQMQSLSLPDVLDIKIASIPDYTPHEWLAESYKGFSPFSVGPFFIHGTHDVVDAPSCTPIALQIDAATAFGSGEHETTAGCLEAMAYLEDQGLCPWNILDMGTGSGILAVAAWKLWKTPVLAVDCDPEAIRVSMHHQDINAIPNELQCVVGDGFSAEAVRRKAPYELIIANILAGSLIDMAPALVATLDENGYVILSGILNTQEARVIEAYAAQGLQLRQRFAKGDWSILVLHNSLA